MAEKKDVQQIVKEAIEPRLQEQFVNGLIGGFKAGCASCYAEVKNMTSAKKIIKKLKEKAEKEYNEINLSLKP